MDGWREGGREGGREGRKEGSGNSSTHLCFIAILFIHSPQAHAVVICTSEDFSIRCTPHCIHVARVGEH